MTDEPRRPMRDDERVRALSLETSATEDEIRKIIELVGSDRGSIIREAHYLKTLTKDAPGLPFSDCPVIKVDDLSISDLAGEIVLKSTPCA